MTFIYKTVNFPPVWTTILKIREIFVRQTLTEHALCEVTEYNYTVTEWRKNLDQIGASFL